MVVRPASSNLPAATRTPAVSATPAAPAMDQLALTPDEQKELKEWENRLRPDLGKLQTPPIGSPPAAQEQAKHYVEDLLKQLAGDEIKKRGLQVRVEVFSGDVPQAGIDDDDWQELTWEDDHPGKPWPIRTWLGAPKEGQRPLYRLVLNLGMLKSLETREELAFVVAQQTARLLEHDPKDPNNEEILTPGNQSYLEPHEMQAGADREAISMMSRAGINPTGAFQALSRLYTVHPPEYPKKDLDRGLVAAAQGQEHEGLRVALVQAEVERLKRKGDPATQAASQPLPAALTIDSPPLYDTEVEDFPKFQADLGRLAEGLATDTTPAWMFGSGVPPKEYKDVRRAGASRADYEAALVGICDQLQQSSHTPQQKVDGFLRTALALGGDCFPEGRPFTAAGSQHIRDFLSANQWNCDTFLTSLSGQGKSLHRDLVQDLIFNETFQNLLAPLSGPWTTLVERSPANWVKVPKDGHQDLESLRELVKKNHKEPRDGWPLNAAIDGATQSYLGALDGPDLARQNGRDGLPQSMVISNDLLSVDLPPEAHQAYRQSLQGLIRAGHEVREEHAQVRLRPPLQNPKQLDGYLHGLFTSETFDAFNPGFEQRLGPLITDVVRCCNYQSDLMFHDDRPGRLESGLERRLCEQFNSPRVADADKQGLVRYLARHWVHEQRLPANSPRREWTRAAVDYLASSSSEQLLKELTEPDLSQHANLICKTLREGYGLTAQDLPDASTGSLEALDKRREAEEFMPKRENYASETEYYQALDAYWDRCDQMSAVMQFVAPAESRLVLGKLAMLGSQESTSREVAGRLDLPQFRSLLRGAEQAVSRSELLTRVTENEETERVGVDAGGFVMDGFLAVQGGIEGLDEWYDLANRSLNFCDGALQARVGTRRKLGDALFPRLETLEGPALREWLGKDHVLDLLSAQQASDLLVKVLGPDCSSETAPATLGKAIAELDTTFKLREEHPVVYSTLRNDVSEKAALQPGTLETVFPPDERGTIEEASVFSKQVRGLSGLLAVTRGRPPQDQLDTVEYLMGRRKDMPAFLEAASESQSFAPIAESIRNTREDLRDSDSNTRVLVANSFLAGPSGVLRSPEGVRVVLDHFLKGVRPQHRELAEKVARAVLSSQGDADTLAVAYVLGQKPKPSDDPDKPAQLDEASILNRLFDAYGVPGIKMKQYLAFTSEFSAFKEAFESAQDAALPLNYFQVLKLVQKRFGDHWPSDLKIDRVLGSGSVNVAIRYTNEATGRREVVSLGREDIEEATRYDFNKFKFLMDELTKTPEDEEKFGYIKGLLKIIEDSVALEFDKEAVLEVQRQAFRTYRHKYPNWTIRSIDAYKVENLGLFMEEAKGKTARKIYNQNPNLYKEAMQPMAQAEFGVLKGQTYKHNWWPKPTFANPDFHDGQVLIDEANKTVTILDFGQAVPIDNKQRECALDILTVIGKGDSVRKACKRLNKQFFGKQTVVTEADLAPIMERKQRMDIFIHLLSLLSRKGADVPLSAVHWVLGLNRQIALSERLGKPIHKQVRNIVINHKIGFGLGVYNTAHAVKETVVKWAAALAHCLGGWALSEPPPEGQSQVAEPLEESYAWHPEKDFITAPEAAPAAGEASA